MTQKKLIYSAFILLSCLPLYYFIISQQYGFWHIEASLWFIPSILLGIVAGFIYEKLGWFGRLLLLILAITTSCSFLPVLQNRLLFWSFCFVIVFIYNFLQEHFLEILTTMLVVFYLSCLIFPLSLQQAKPIQQTFKHFEIHQQLPPIIYLILDEHAAPNILPDRQLGQYIAQVYRQYGLSEFTNVHSNYSVTYDSISNVLNFSNQSLDNYYFANEKANRSLTTNALFSLLSQKGYQIRIYQTDYLDYCHAENANIASCFTVPVANVANIQSLKLPVQQKALFFLKSLLLQSYYWQVLSYYYQFHVRVWAYHVGWHLPAWEWNQARTASIPTPLVFKQIENDITQNANGTVFFAHILAPHNPYVYNAKCQIVPKPTAWQINIGPDPLVNSKASYQRRYDLYQQQTACTLTRMQQFFAFLQTRGILQKSIIIVHGDHGSRIMMNLPVAGERLTKQDFLDTYRTLFFYKLPNQAIVEQKQSIALVNAVIDVINQAFYTKIKPVVANQSVYILAKKPDIQLPVKAVGDFK